MSKEIKRSYKLTMLVAVLCLIVIVGSTTYAYFKTRISGSGTKIDISGKTFDLNINENSITLNSLKPIYDKDKATKANIKTFTVSGGGVSSGCVSIYLTLDSIGTNLITRFLKYELLDGSTLVSAGDFSGRSAGSNVSLAKNISLSDLSSKSYTLRIWLSYDADTDQSSILTGTKADRTLKAHLKAVGTTGACKELTLKDAILKDNTTISSRTSFSNPFNTNTTGTLFTSTESITGITSTPQEVYYYAGNTTNNWVLFGGFYWRIIRTNHDKSIRLLYVGTSHDTTEGYIGISEFNTNSDSPKYVGYKYGEDDSTLDGIRTNTTDSTIKTYIDTWYQNNLTNYTKYLSASAVYCNDRSEETEGSYSTSTSFKFIPNKRLYTDITPTYNCSDIKDAFSVENTSAKLDYPIALMTADEVAFAGGTAPYASMSTPYAWFVSNSAGIKLSSYWWTLSPYNWNEYAFEWRWRSGNTYGDCANNLGNAVRPVISLKSCALYGTGNGTAENPYTIQETESGC